jgi:hypothetical protein
MTKLQKGKKEQKNGVPVMFHHEGGRREGETNSTRQTNKGVGKAIREAVMRWRYKKDKGKEERNYFAHHFDRSCTSSNAVLH